MAGRERPEVRLHFSPWFLMDSHCWDFADLIKLSGRICSLSLPISFWALLLSWIKWKFSFNYLYAAICISLSSQTIDTSSISIRFWSFPFISYKRVLLSREWLNLPLIFDTIQFVLNQFCTVLIQFSGIVVNFSWEFGTYSEKPKLP